MEKITINDIKNNKQFCILIPMYAIILSVVYDAWIYYTINWLWLEILLPIVLMSFGFLFTYLSTVKKKKLLATKTDK